MIVPGLISATFNHLSHKEVIELTSSARLSGIEWGGRVHVRPGDLKTARLVRRMTEEAGLLVSSYGSMYALGQESQMPFGQVLETALALGTPVIRVWAGDKASAEVDRDSRDALVIDAHRIADLAENAEAQVSFEFHRVTLTDTPESAVDLLQSVGKPNVRTYWQPYLDRNVDANLAGLDAVLPWLTNIHVYHWTEDWTRLPLKDGIPTWRRYLEAASKAVGDRWAHIEFVRDDDPKAFMEDAEVLKELIEYAVE